MSAYDSEDKNHLAMLAIPVILSMLLGFSGEVRAAEQMEIEPTPTERVERENRVGSSGVCSEVAETEENNRKSEILKAVADGDYDRFLSLTKNTPFADIMTEPAFAALKEQYQHSRDGFIISPYPDRGSPLS